MIEPRIQTTLLDKLQKGETFTTYTASITVHASQRYMQQLFCRLKKDGKVYIIGWTRAKTNQNTPIYAWGNKPDAPRPRTLTSAERNRALRKIEAYREKINFNRRAKRSLERNVRLGIWGL